MLSIGAMAIQRLFRPPLPHAVDIDDEDILMKSILMKLVFAIAAACIVSSAPLRAQVAGASLSGTITDASGGAICRRTGLREKHGHRCRHQNDDE